MRRLRILLTALMVCLLTACQSRRYGPTAEEQAAREAIGEAYSRSRKTTNHGDVWVTVSLLDDATLVASCEELLVRHATHGDASVRREALQCLAYFGTETALNRALALAKAEANANVRTPVWRDLIGLLNPPDAKRREFGYRYCGPDFAVPPDGYLFPPGFDLAVIRSAVLEEYATDDGVEVIRYVDRIPFVPFYREEGECYTDIREQLAEWLSPMEEDDPLFPAFREFARHPDPRIHGPARKLVDTVSVRPLRPDR